MRAPWRGRAQTPEFGSGEDGGEFVRRSYLKVTVAACLAAFLQYGQLQICCCLFNALQNSAVCRSQAEGLQGSDCRTVLLVTLLSHVSHPHACIRLNILMQVVQRESPPEIQA